MVQPASQFKIGGYGNIMLEAKLVVAGSSPAWHVLIIRKENKNGQNGT